MNKVSVILFVVAMAGTVAMAQVGPPHVGFWVDGELYKTIGTPTELPNKGPKDGIYVFQGLSGQTPVAEAKPGDQDYNGGRWQVIVLEFTESGMSVHDPDDDGNVNFELMSWEEVEEHIAIGHLETVGYGPSFECPVIKDKH